MTTTAGSSPKAPVAPSKSSEALRLRSIGLTNKQVAAVLGVPVPSARRLVSEAKRVGHESHALEILEKAMPGFGAAYSQRTHKKPTHLVIPDTQCKPGVPLDHLLWAGKYIAERKPDVVVHLGDHFDMPSLSSYDGRGSRAMEGKRYKADIEAGNTGLHLLMEGMGSFRPKRMILLRGNHEDRIERAINEDPKLEGIIGYHDFDDVKLGWEPVDYLKPICVDGIWYCHFFYHRNTGRAYTGSMDSRLRAIGHTFSQGHQQGLQWGRRELDNGTAHVGLVAGSYYLHSEEYRGAQANNEWRGLVVKHEVGGGTYDPMMVSLDYLRDRFS